MFEVPWIGDLMLVLAAAGLVVPLFGRLRFGVVPGFLLTGFILGPGALGHLVPQAPWLSIVTFSDAETVRPIAELGVLFLLFLIGLEFSFDRLWSMRRLVFGLGSVQVFVSAAALVAAAYWWLGDATEALVIGLTLALSSTAIVTQLLIESHRFALPVGRASLAVLLFQDLMVVPLVVIVGLLGGETEIALSGALATSVAVGIVSVGFIVIAGRYLLRPLIALSAQSGSRELLIAISLFSVIGAALLTALAGLSPALGAFLAGILLGSTPFRHQIEVDIEPFKGLLLGLFFMTVGMTLDITMIAAMPWVLVGAVLALTMAKALIAVVAARLLGLPLAVAFEAALLLAGAGEFAFVLFSLAEEAHVLSPPTHTLAVTVAALSMLTIPVLAVLGRLAADRHVRRAAARTDGTGLAPGPETAELAGHVVIGGFGRVGQAVARVLEAEQIPYVAIDRDAESIPRLRREGRNVFFGDVGRREILDRVGGASARAFVVTPNNPVAAERMVEAIAGTWPAASIHARAADVAHAERLMAAGAADVVPEALESSMVLSGHLLAGLGLPDDAVQVRLGIQREAEMRRLATSHEDAPGA